MSKTKSTADTTAHPLGWKITDFPSSEHYDKHFTKSQELIGHLRQAEKNYTASKQMKPNRDLHVGIYGNADGNGSLHRFAPLPVDGATLIAITDMLTVYQLKELQFAKDCVEYAEVHTHLPRSAFDLGHIVGEWSASRPKIVEGQDEPQDGDNEEEHY